MRRRRPPPVGDLAGRSETDFVHALLPKLCDTGRVLVWRNNSGTAVLGKGRGVIRVGTPGMSDVMGVLLDGSARILSFELKSATAKWTTEQRAWLDRVRDIGGVACDYRYDLALSWEENLSRAVTRLSDAIWLSRSSTDTPWSPG